MKKFVEEFRATGKNLSVLINNAGLALNFKDTKRQYTKDNFELTMGTNHIGNVTVILPLSPFPQLLYLGRRAGSGVVTIDPLRFLAGRRVKGVIMSLALHY